MDVARSIDTVKRYLRRRHTGTTDAERAAGLAQLRALADQIMETATDAVTLTGQSFDGGSHQGTLVFPRLAYLEAVEDVIAELDTSTTAIPPTPDRAYARLTFGVSAFPASAGNNLPTS